VSASFVLFHQWPAFDHCPAVGWMSFEWWTILDTHRKLLSVKSPAALQFLTQTCAPGTYYHNPLKSTSIFCLAPFTLWMALIHKPCLIWPCLNQSFLCLMFCALRLQYELHTAGNYFRVNMYAVRTVYLCSKGDWYLKQCHLIRQGKTVDPQATAAPLNEFRFFVPPPLKLPMPAL
jgi:hypothetical protein